MRLCFLANASSPNTHNWLRYFVSQRHEVDCISFQPRPLDRIGVYAVREAPILFHNLLASLREKRLKAFKPQKKYLLIFNLGDDTGIIVRGSFVWKSKLAFKLKDYIDTGFMRKSQES